MSERLVEMYSHFERHSHVILTTVEGKQPRTRPITLIKDDDGFFFATGSGSQKIDQIRENPAAEFILNLKEGDNNGYIRGECTAELVHEKGLVASIFQENEFMWKLWESPEDPTLTIVRLTPKAFHYMKPGEWETTEIRIDQGRDHDLLNH